MPRLRPAAANADSSPDGAVIDMAISWFIRLQGGARPEDRRKFDKWLASSPQHALAWQRIQSLGERVEGVPADIGLTALENARSRKQARRSTLKTLGLVLAGGGAAAWLGSNTRTWQAATADYTTSTGQRRTVTLGDGTEIVMNTGSALNVRFDEHSRWIDLLRGEICVTTGQEVGAGPARPFQVRTEFGTLRALGTRFLVRLGADQARLCVEQGAVEIAVPAGMRATGRVGETLLFDSRRVVREEKAELSPTAWLDGVLIVRGMPLSRFLDELSRYRQGIITCDEAVAHLPVFGAYQTGDPDKALALVAAGMKLRLSYRTRFWVLVGRQDTGGKKNT